MPELLNFLYEQHAYHKILPSEFNLSMKISPLGFSVDAGVLPRRALRVCDNFSGQKNSWPITRFFVQS